MTPIGSLTYASIEVQGLPELYQALGDLDISLQEHLREGLLEGAEPIRRRAESLSMSEITNMTDHWARMKIGVTGKALVYLAPFSRRTAGGLRRPNLSTAFLNKAMIPAAIEGEPETTAAVQKAVTRAIREAGF